MTEPCRVLVVDDDETIREFVEWALTDEGYEVAAVPDGAAALEILPSFRPALILLDMRMPVMDGWAFAAAYHSLPPPHAPIVVLTAARPESNSALEVGAVDMLAKPFDLEMLLAMTRKHTKAAC